MNEIRSYIGKRLQDKTSQVETGVRDDKRLICGNIVIKKENVQINWARSPGNLPFSVEYIRFDTMEFCKKLVRGKRCCKHYRPIEEIGLRHTSDRLGIVKR